MNCSTRITVVTKSNQGQCHLLGVFLLLSVVFSINYLISMMSAKSEYEDCVEAGPSKFYCDDWLNDKDEDKELAFLTLAIVSCLFLLIYPGISLLVFISLLPDNLNFTSDFRSPYGIRTRDESEIARLKQWSTYFGFSTRINRIKWSIFSLLLVLGLAFFISYLVTMIKAKNQFEDCVKSRNDFRIKEYCREEHWLKEEPIIIVFANLGIIFLLFSLLPLISMLCCSEPPQDNACSRNSSVQLAEVAQP